MNDKNSFQKKFCVYCCPIDLPKGCIFHPTGEKKECPNCGKMVRSKQIVVCVYIPGGKNNGFTNN